MTIEATLERIADALETLTGKLAHIDAAVSPAPEAETPEPAKASKPKAAKPKAAKPKPAADKDAEAKTIDDVRAALKALQKATDAATAKELLQSFDATTLSALEEDSYAELIEKAEGTTRDALAAE